MGVQFGLLGDVEVRIDGRLVEMGHARQRGVLVVLLIEANRVVSAVQLVHRMWGERAPQRARATIYNYLSRLRQALSPLPGVDLVRQAGGYVLTVDPMAVDVHRFSRLVGQARTTTDEDQALTLIGQALQLWRGEPFAGLDTPWLTAQRDALQRDRFAVELDYTDLQLRRGRHGWLLNEIADRAAAHPLDERVAGQLMLALYRCGRQAEALEHFQRLRTQLAEELGIDPSPALYRLYEQILTTDAVLTTPTGSAPASTPPPVPRQLPAHTPHFVGRKAELRQLSTLLGDTATAGGGTVMITTIDGTAGVGKTALALHWAHHVAERFPDGQLYVNLRGFDPTNAPLHPGDALRGFLDAFQVPAQRIPTSPDAQAGLYRSLLADRRVLVVLDNARNTEQARPLLPASPTCLVIITSRNQLAGLVAQDGAHPVTLDVLSPRDARGLLAQHLGPDRINAEPAAVTDLINHCAHLPLALAIVAARASTNPGFALNALVKELADEQTRLDALDTGEPATSIRPVFSWSYHHLSAPAARVFRLLGLHPGPDIALPAATRLADLLAHQGREALDELTRAHLLTQHTPGRYSFHDLLRAYATHLVTTHDSEDDQEAALTRLFDHYLHTTAAAMNTLHPTDQPRDPHLPPDAAPTPPITNPTTAQQWLDTERANLTAIITHAASHGWHTHTTQLAKMVIFRSLESGGPFRGGSYRDALAIYTHVRQAARHTGDSATEALALTQLGTVCWYQGRPQQATEHHEQALTICRSIGFRFGEALALSGIGLLSWHQGHYQQAIDYYQQAIAMCRDAGNQAVEAWLLTAIGLVKWRQGHYQQSTDHHQQALAICRDIGHRLTEAFALTHLGRIQWQQGHVQQATDHHQQALAISRDIGFQSGEALALTHLGLVTWRQGHYPQAIDHHQQALAICRDIGYRTTEALVLTHLGCVFAQQGHVQQATGHHQQALALSRDIGFRFVEPLALTGLGDVYGQQGDHHQATEYYQQALDLFRQIGDRANEPQILNGLGLAHYAHGELRQAQTQHTAALALATELGDRYEQARAHHGLAHIHHVSGELDNARHHGRQALAGHTDLGVPDTHLDHAGYMSLDSWR